MDRLAEALGEPHCQTCHQLLSEGKVSSLAQQALKGEYDVRIIMHQTSENSFYAVYKDLGYDGDHVAMVL